MGERRKGFEEKSLIDDDMIQYQKRLAVLFALYDHDIAWKAVPLLLTHFSFRINLGFLHFPLPSFLFASLYKSR